MASRQVTSGAAVVLLEPVVLLELLVPGGGPEVLVVGLSGMGFSSESKHEEASADPITSASAMGPSRGVKPRDMRVKVAANRGRDEHPPPASPAAIDHDCRRGASIHGTPV
jgi:hypothetical protein